MGVVPLTIATLMYVWTAYDLWRHQANGPLALTFAAYGVANLGLIWAAYRHIWEQP